MNRKRLAREIQNTARLVGAMGPHRLLTGIGRVERNLTAMGAGTRAHVEALYQLAGAVWAGDFTEAQVAAWR